MIVNKYFIYKFLKKYGMECQLTTEIEKNRAVARGCINGKFFNISLLIILKLQINPHHKVGTSLWEVAVHSKTLTSVNV